MIGCDLLYVHLFLMLLSLQLSAHASHTETPSTQKAIASRTRPTVIAASIHFSNHPIIQSKLPDDGSVGMSTNPEHFGRITEDAFKVRSFDGLHVESEGSSDK